MAIKAFPHEEWLDTTDPKVLNPIRHHGMDLRDYFAAKAMQAILYGSFTRIGQEGIEDNRLPYQNVEDLISKTAYEYADAMMEERNGD